MKASINNFNEICRLVDESRVISFDIYDTALLRNTLDPTDIFDIVQLEINKLGVQLTNFKNLRIKAEKKARSRSSKDDISFDEIYYEVSEELGAGIIEILKELELKVESRFTTQNPFIKKVYDYASSKNKIILFISDMYLDPTFLVKLLEENGYDSFDGIYVSGTIGVSKASLQMYDYVRRSKDISDPWLHIGDNRISDYDNALRSGLHAYYYKALRERVLLPRKYSIEYSIMKAIQINYSRTMDGLNYWQQFGIDVVSALFFGFVNWLVKELKGRDNVYFLSRDGYLPWKLYEKFRGYIDGLPEATYLYASRKMYQLPNILDMEQEEVLELLTYSNANLGEVKRAKEIFDDIGIDISCYKHLLEEFSIREDTLLLDNDKRKMKKILEVIYPDIISNLSNRRQLLNEYLKCNGLFTQSELHIVDVGWRGSTHRAIKDITKVKTTGYYFGTSYNVYDDIKQDVKGYAFHLGSPLRMMRKVMDNVMMYEFIFSAPHGSLINLEKGTEGIKPKLTKDPSNQLQIIEHIQCGVLHIFSYYLKYLEYLKDVRTIDCVQDYMDFIKNKKYEDLRKFEEITIKVGFGESSKKLRFVTSISIREYLKNKKSIKKIAQKNLWKNALIVEGSSNEFDDKVLNIKLYNSFLTKDRLIKALRNPQKTFKYIRRMMQSKKN